jgi:hypothetical protein
METVAILGTGNVGFGNTDADIVAKLDLAVDLGLAAVRSNAGKGAMLGGSLSRGAFIMEQCALRDLRVLFNFVIPRNQLNDPDVTVPSLQQGGYLWGQMVEDSPHAAAVIGFEIQNEFDLDVADMLSKHGHTAAVAMAATHAEVIRSFSQGVRAAPGAWPAAATLLPGGMANPESEEAVTARGASTRCSRSGAPDSSTRPGATRTSTSTPPTSRPGGPGPSATSRSWWP